MISARTDRSPYDLSFLSTLFFVGLASGCLLSIVALAMNNAAKSTADSSAEPLENARLTNLDPDDDKDDKIVTYDPGVHVFPAKDFPQRLAEFIDQNRQTVVVSVSPLLGPPGPANPGSANPRQANHGHRYLVLTRPDPEWLKILPGSARPPGALGSPNRNPEP